MDAHGDDGGTWIAGLIHDFTQEENTELAERLHLSNPLLNGSRYWCHSLGVHPACSGRQIEARLLAHALFTCIRASGDLAVLEAFPLKSMFDASVPPRTIESVRKLVSYYQWVGFRRVRPDDPIKCSAVAMHTQFGARGLPVKGLGGLTYFPRGETDDT